MAVTEAEPLANQRQPAPAPTRRVKLGTILKLGVAVGVMAFILARAGLGALYQALAEADWRWVLLALGLATAAMVVNTARWQLMLRGQGARVPLVSLVRLYLVAMFFNNVLPSRFGADVVRAYGAAGMGTSKTQSAAAVLMDRLVGAISVLALGSLAIALRSSDLPPVFLQMIVAGSAMSLVALAFMVYRNDRLANLRLRVLAMTEISVLGFKLRPRLETALNALRSYSRAPGIVVQGFLISLVANGLSVINLYLYALAVRAEGSHGLVGLGDVATIAPFILAIGLVPISPNGIGTIEAAMVVLFGALGVDEHVALAVALLRRLSLLVLSLVGGVLYALRRRS